MKKKETAKERILRTGSDLFYREGVRAVGIDRIIEESGVAKASFYRNFATKDDLIVEYLEQYYHVFMKPFEEAGKRYPEDSVEQLYYLVECLGARVEQPGYRGCPFLNAAVEFPDKNHPSQERVITYHRETQRNLSLIAERAGAGEPETLSAQLMMLFNGALMTAYLDRTSYHTDYFRSAAKLLIKRQISLIVE
ncbi:TetR family transcriptional regulator [Brevibacillus reuszeri]|uniref:TetR family transcriptional regulator n=1 Tax=Brevibacillus reuszeri TaxID=54915 RepID=A0A0K9YQ11_9BACL|nr:TetR/AcrR family transcriptional regulator [Brevibacillus reuszeri]KNB70742.1 TetR family transcriptional regulator [Brevibacillus reuszeri]MED1861237.1 TetR/AcrR family transcriptional regulator [Brevibacillus reuszeri]GED69776.1 TetR family transcriptional regulator [Brevibacillus reuszeri]